MCQLHNSRLTVQTADILCLYSPGLCGPSGLRQPPHINTDPFPLGVLTANQGRRAQTMSQLQRPDTSHNRHWLMQCKSSLPCVFRQKQTDGDGIQVSRMQHNVVCYPRSEVHDTKLHFRGSTDTKMEKRNTQMSVNSTISITELIVFNSALLIKYWRCIW